MFKKIGLLIAASSALVLVGCNSGGSVSAPVAEQVAETSGYQPYKLASVNKAVEEGKDVAVFFHGATCGSCAKLDTNIKANSADIPADTVIFNADWDNNQDLAVEYGVDKYHTVTMVTNGKKNVKGLFELRDILSELDDSAPQAAVPAPKVVSNYQPYTLASVNKAVDEGKDVAVFFHGATCGSCAKLDANIKANSAKIPADTVIFNADWDDNQDLAVEYGVDKYHTVTMVTNGKKNVKGLFELDGILEGLSDSEENAGSYAPYNLASVNKAVEDGKKVAVFFHGATCGSCAKLDANIKENADSIPADVAIFNADWDDNQDLAVEYGVDKYHTVTMVTNGKKNVKGLFDVNGIIGNL